MHHQLRVECGCASDWPLSTVTLGQTTPPIHPPPPLPHRHLRNTASHCNDEVCYSLRVSSAAEAADSCA